MHTYLDRCFQLNYCLTSLNYHMISVCSTECESPLMAAAETPSAAAWKPTYSPQGSSSAQGVYPHRSAEDFLSVTTDTTFRDFHPKRCVKGRYFSKGMSQSFSILTSDQLIFHYLP